jgi:PAS domain S-box-containing protein
MAAVKMKLKEKKPGTPPSERSLRNAAEEQLVLAHQQSPDVTQQTAEELIHELQVHQTELEMQAEELRRTQLALEESRDKYLDRYEFAPFGYLTLNEKALITEVNLTGATLLGVERGTLLKAPFSKFVAEKDADEWYRYFKNVLIQEEKQICTLTLKRSDGSTFPARLESIRITGKSDGPPTVRVTISDITDIRLAEEKAGANLTKYQVLFESVPLGITVSDKAGNIVESNRMAEHLLGLPKKDQVDRQIDGREWRIIRPDGSLMPADEFASVMALQENRLIANIEMGIVKGEEDITWINVTAAPVPLEGYGVAIAYSDITDRKRTEEALQKSERFLTNIVEQIPDMIFVKDARDLRFVQLNKAGEDLLGYSRAEILGKNDYDLFPNDEAVFFTGNDRQVLLTNQVSDNPNEKILTRYKGERILHTKKIPIVDEKGVPGYLLGISEDITERKRVWDALQESERKFRNLYRYAQVGLFEISFKDLTVVACNERVATIAGFSSIEDATGKDIAHLFENPDDIKEITRIIHQEGHIDDHIIRIKNHLSGSPLWVQFSARFNHEKNVAEGSIIDITGRKRVEDELVRKNEELNAAYEQLTASEDVLRVNYTELATSQSSLKEAKDYLESLIRYANVPIISWNPELTITEFNRAFEHLSGMTREEVIGQSLAILFTDTTREKYMALIRRALMGKHLKVVEIPIRHISGETRIVLWNSTNILDTTGKVIATIAQGQDITKRKAAEEALRKFSEDLEQTVAERTSGLTDISLSLMTEIDIRLDAEKQLTKSVGEKEVLLREVHHRVKNNLQIIISLLNLQSRYIPDAATRSVFRESQNRVRAMALVHEKLYQSTDLAKLDLGNYLKFLGDNLFQFLGMKGKGITLTIDVHDISLAIDTAIPLGLMINELISNSLKYAFSDGKKGEISLAVKRQDHTLTILFKDTGIGIPSDFDWRNAESLGLRLVCSLVEQLDGTIELDRSSGTAFTIVVKEKV